MGGRGVCHGGTPALPCSRATIGIPKKVLFFGKSCAEDIILLAFLIKPMGANGQCLPAKYGYTCFSQESVGGGGCCLGGGRWRSISSG